jgi:predicted Zn-dependent protease
VWFGASALANRDEDCAQALLSQSTRIDAATARRVADLIDGAARLNPDRTVELLRARLALERGDRAKAERIVGRVTAAEPKNLEAWALVAQAAPDTATLRRAYAHISVLVPDVRRPR